MKLLAKRKMQLVLLLLFGSIAYWHGLSSEFIGDDHLRISEVEHYLAEGYLSSLVNILPDRPVLMVTIYVNYLISGVAPWSYKAFSLILHIFLGFLLVHFFEYMQEEHDSATGKSRWFVPFFITLLFVIHPANSQAILSSIQRGVILAAIGGLGALLFFVKYSVSYKRNYLFIALLCFLIGILSKQSIVTFPIIFLLYLWIFKRCDLKHLKSILPFFLILLFPVMQYFFFGVNKQSFPETLKWYEYLSVQSRVVFIYLKLFFYPGNLHFYYEINKDPHLLHNLTWLAILGHVFLITTAVVIRKRQPHFAFGILSTYLAFVPESSFFPIRHVAFEHRTYIPYLFVCYTVCMFLVNFSHWFKKNLHLVIFFATFTILLLVGITVNRTYEVDTYDKWTVNTFEHRHPTRKNKLVLLGDLYFCDSFELGLQYAKKFVEDEPGHGPYVSYYRLFQYEFVETEVKRQIVYDIEKVLISRNDYKYYAKCDVANFLYFTVTNLRKLIKDEELFNKRIEKIFRTQQSFFLASKKYFSLQIKHHILNLLYLKNFYSKKKSNGLLNSSEKKQLNQVLAQLALYEKELRY